MNAKYKPIALYILENYIDEIMTESDFKRRSNALVYSRTIGTTKQKLEMVCYSHPPYYAGSLLHIYPYMSVYFPEINKTAENMISNRCCRGKDKDIYEAIVLMRLRENTRKHLSI